MHVPVEPVAKSIASSEVPRNLHKGGAVGLAEEVTGVVAVEDGDGLSQTKQATNNKTNKWRRVTDAVLNIM